jgi:glycine cleavage system H protein
MFPWVYGFTWDAGNVIFLGIFFTVVGIIAGTVTLAALRAYKDHRARRHEAIRWQGDFHDLPGNARACRHEMTGELKQRNCPNGFDCRICQLHGRLLEVRQDGTALQDNSLPQLALSPDFDMPQDRLYHRGHTWVKMEVDGTATIGLDDFCIRMLGTPEDVTLPPVGTLVHVNGSGWHIRRNGTVIRILSPIEGCVTETGSPEQGWYLKVRPLATGIDTRHLLHGEEIRPWIRREMDRLVASVGSVMHSPTLADGGEPVKDFAQALPDAHWDGILGELFLEP